MLPASHANSSRAANRGRQLRIVIADDSRDTVLTLSAILRDEGHDVYGLHSADQVIKTVRLIRPDVVILDIEMPGMSGYALAQELRSLYYGSANAPLLIAISGKWVKVSDQMLARVVGFAHHLMKPCDPNQLLELIAPLQKISHT
jgi:DNA-binding response OmpR family regulator